MKLIESNFELNLIKIERTGFVFNDRPETKKVHHAACDSVTAMMASPHQKFFSKDKKKAKQWLDQQYGTDGWVNCGICYGLDSTTK